MRYRLGNGLYFDYSDNQGGELYRIGDGQLHGRLGRIPSRLLWYLITHCGGWVSRGELFVNVWRERFVTNMAITQRVKEVRRLLEGSECHIMTKAGAGYRFVGDVEVHNGRPTAANALPTEREVGEKPTCEIEFTIETEYSKFSEADLQRILQIVREFLGMDGTKEIRLIRKRPGSVKITLALPQDKAKELLGAINAGQLEEYGVVDAELLHTTGRIRLVLAVDHPIFLQGLALVLGQEPDFEVVAGCRHGEAVLQAVRQHHPDVLILDRRILGKDGLTVLRELHQAKLPTRVVLLTAAADDDHLLEAMRLGVSAVILTQTTVPMLIQCVRQVHAGDQWSERHAISRALDKTLRRETGARELATILTPRELEIVRLAASGLRNKEIASQLVISEGTVKIHLHRSFEKLHLKSRVDLRLYAQDEGRV